MNNIENLFSHSRDSFTTYKNNTFTKFWLIRHATLNNEKLRDIVPTIYKYTLPPRNRTVNQHRNRKNRK